MNKQLTRPSLLALLTLLLFVTAGCDLLGGDDGEDERVTEGIYIANQGDFGTGNGSVTRYDPSTGAVATPVSGLGTIIQSIALYDDALYVLSNTGSRVDVFDAEGSARIGQIPVTNPRYMAAVSPTKAYVTSQLYSGPSMVTIVNPQTLARVDSIIVGGSAEGIALVGKRAFVATGAFGATSEVVMIDTDRDAVVQTIDVDCDAPRYVEADSDGEVWVFCAGTTLFDENWNPVGQTNGAIRVLDGDSGAIVKRIHVDGRIASAGPGQDAFFSPEAELLFAVKNGDRILRFNTRTNELLGEFGPVAGDPIGAVAFDAASNRLYLGRVPGYTEQGAVTVHDLAGTEIAQMTAGIAPAYIALRRK